MPVWEIIGWVGSILVVVSLMIPSVRKFRILNLTGSLIATVYNAYFGIWPYMVMNGAIVLINVYWLWRLYRCDSEGERVYEVVGTSGEAPVVQRFVERNHQDILRAYPQFSAESLGSASVFLVLYQEEIVGVIALQATVEGRCRIVLDFVTERFRDLTPGKHVYSDRELFAGIAATEVEISPDTTSDVGYFKRLGFTAEGSVLVKTVA